MDSPELFMPKTRYMSSAIMIIPDYETSEDLYQIPII